MFESFLERHQINSCVDSENVTEKSSRNTMLYEYTNSVMIDNDERTIAGASAPVMCISAAV
jgi:hypothetical protein